MKFLFTLFFAVATMTAMTAQKMEKKAHTLKPAPVEMAAKGDVSTVDAIIAALYDVISGPATKKRDWERMKNLFKPDARLQATGVGKDGKARWTSMTVDEYIERNSPFFEKQGFFETEMARTTDTYGFITQIFSTYQATFSEKGPVQMRGINSIQLVYDGERYWITNILWNQESKAHPIPEKYLIPQKETKEKKQEMMKKN